MPVATRQNADVMIRWRDGRVAEIGSRRRGAIELTVTTADGLIPAIAYPELVGEPQPGDRVLLNTTTFALGLGTGGFAMVVALPDRLPPDVDRPGHVVKARYTPLQATVLAVDEPDSPHYAALQRADDLAGLPVVVAPLHSAVAAVVAGIRTVAPTARVVYLMTDGGALPLGFSQSYVGLRDAEWLVASVTVGQAFGGDLEAVTVHTGLLAARHVLDADVVVTTQGPGNLGTGTKWGFSGVASGEAVNAVGALGGRAVAALRLSQADPRPRHRGVSHHSVTALGRVAVVAADIAVPRLAGRFGEEVRAACAQLSPPHRLVDVEVGGLEEALRACPVTVSSMGRGLDEDPAYFLGCAVAGRHAASLL